MTDISYVKSIYIQYNYYLLAGNYDKAKELLLVNIRSHPDDLSLLGKLVNILFEYGEQDLIIDVLKEVEYLTAYPYRIKWNFAAQLLVLSKYSEALPYFQYCVDHGADRISEYALANAHARLGICHAYLGNDVDAENELLYAQRITPWDIDMCQGFILLFRMTNRHEKILEFIDRKIVEHPYLYPLYYWKADHINNYLYNKVGAIEWYRAALNRLRSSNYKRNYFHQYISASQVVNPENIIQDYIDILIITKRWQGVLMESLTNKMVLWKYINRKLLKIREFILTENFSSAQLECKAMLNKKNKPVRTSILYSYLSTAQMKLGAVSESLQSAHAAIALDKYNPGGWEALSRVLISKQEWAEAIKVLEKMIAYDPYFSDLLEEMGKCYLSLGDIETAKSYLLRTITLDPFDSNAWFTLGSIHEESNNHEDAIQAYKTALAHNNLTEQNRDLLNASLKNLGRI
jgi:tetratricopeptide (TPR) repeat protein